MCHPTVLQAAKYGPTYYLKAVSYLTACLKAIRIANSAKAQDLDSRHHEAIKAEARAHGRAHRVGAGIRRDIKKYIPTAIPTV